MDTSRPHIYRNQGNGVFCHIPSNFTDAEAESWINKERPLGDVLWKRAPTAIDGTPSRVDCPDNHGNHILFTMDGKPLVPGNDDGGGMSHANPGLPQELIEALGLAGMDVEVIATGSMDKGGLAGLGQALKQLAERNNTGKPPSLDTLFEQLHHVADQIPRPQACHINVTGYGAGSLLNFKPELGKKNREFMQELMRGPSSLTPLQREIIATNISLANNAMYCAMAHRATARELAGSQEAWALAIHDPKLAALGAFAVAVNERINLPEGFIERVKAQGWDDEALHDTAMVVGAFNMMNTYVEGLAAVTPKDEASYKAVGERLAQKGYTATA